MPAIIGRESYRRRSISNLCQTNENINLELLIVCNVEIHYQLGRNMGWDGDSGTLPDSCHVIESTLVA